MHAHKPVPVSRLETPWFKAGAILAMTALSVLICWLAPVPKAGGEAGVDMYLPISVGDFHGVSSSHDPSPAEREILPADTTYAKMNYETASITDGKRLSCSIVLSGAERRSIHRPERCLPSQGWRIESSHVASIPLNSGHTLQTTALLLSQPVTLNDGSRAMRRSYFVYWFVGKGITTPYHFERILMTNWELLAHRVNQRWAYVVVESDIPQATDPGTSNDEKTLEVVKQFIHDSVPYFMKSEMTASSSASN